jgi:predicted NBD/HSP70 family sugar kinase
MTKRKPDGQPGNLPTHGALSLPSVAVDSYNLQIEDEDGFVGDKASKSAFRELLDDVRRTLREGGTDPFGSKASHEISNKELDALLAKRDAKAGAVVQSAIEKFAGRLAGVIKRFLRQKPWRDAEHVVVGGGLRASRVGELAVGRAAILLKENGTEIELSPIHNHPDEAGLIGTVHLLPPWMVKGHHAILAVDIGGTNIRAGIVELNLKKAKDLSEARIADMERWRHRDETGIGRDEAVDRLTGMLKKFAKSEKNKLRLAPVIGIGCPGLIREDGSIETGAQNLPGNWESRKFNLPRAIREAMPHIGEHETMVVMHNDAVVQGLSELPYAEGWKRWAVLTIGTGLGNASFSMRRSKKRKA